MKLVAFVTKERARAVRGGLPNMSVGRLYSSVEWMSGELEPWGRRVRERQRQVPLQHLAVGKIRARRWI